MNSNWNLAKVRGSRYNQCDGILNVLEFSAVPTGHWSGAHATATAASWHTR